jgi:hypothetical protein
MIMIFCLGKAINKWTRKISFMPNEYPGLPTNLDLKVPSYANYPLREIF